MAEDLTIPSPDGVLELLTAFRRSKTMFTAVELGVFDALTSGPRTLPELAHKLRANEDALERLLDACVGLKLLRHASSPTGVKAYDITPEARTYLCADSPRRMTGYIHYSNTAMWKLWGALTDAVREGTHRWKQVFGWEGSIFAHLFHDERAKYEFLMGMHGFGMISSPAVVGAFDLSGYHLFADLGGATGHLAIAAAERYPQLRAIVFDLPEAVPLAKQIVGESAVSERIEISAGDFFNDPLPPADIYALGRIVHDWTQEKIAQLLKRIYEALPSGGSLLIAEKVLAEDKSGPAWAQMQSLNMLTCTEGKERNLTEYEQILTQAGFRDVRLRRTDSPLDAILAKK